MATHSFSAPIMQARGGGAYVMVPLDPEKVFGKKRVPVLATIDGVAYRGSLFPMMGGEGTTLGVLKEIRQQIGKDVGDVVEVVLEEDTAPREIEVPADLRSAFAAAPSAQAFFETLSYSRQKEFVTWIESAKREATRSERVTASIEKLTSGQKLR